MIVISYEGREIRVYADFIKVSAASATVIIKTFVLLQNI